jgi:hypothetical protein
MNLKISASLLALGTLTSAVLLGTTPVSAQTGNGSDVGNNVQFLINQVQTFAPSSITPPIQAALTTFSQSVNPNSVSPAVFSALSGGSPAPLAAALIPTGVTANGPTATSAADLAASLNGVRDAGGNINAQKASIAVGKYNAYVAALVAEVGGDKAIASIADAQKSANGKAEGGTTAQQTTGAFLSQISGILNSK